jgi:hypothetical protein
MNKKLIIPIVIVLAILFFPVKVDCGALGASCVTAPSMDNKGNSYYDRFYDIEPLGVMLIEIVTRNDFPIKYYRDIKTIEIMPNPNIGIPTY